MRPFRLVALAVVFLVLAVTARPQQQADIQGLYLKLGQPETSDEAARHILSMAETDAVARGYIAQRLPAMIKQSGIGPVWQNAVRLAGQLRANEATPQLVNALGRGAVGGDGTHTMSRNARLEDDIVAKALAQIGDPAVPSVARLLKNSDRYVRLRMIWILININTDLSRKAMRDHLKVETDPAAKSLIQEKLGIDGASQTRPQ
jgi:hypothetical protein